MNAQPLLMHQAVSAFKAELTDRKKHVPVRPIKWPETRSGEVVYASKKEMLNDLGDRNWWSSLGKVRASVKVAGGDLKEMQVEVLDQGRWMRLRSRYRLHFTVPTIEDKWPVPHNKDLEDIPEGAFPITMSAVWPAEAITFDVVHKLISELYTKDEQRQLKEASDAVFEKYEIISVSEITRYADLKPINPQFETHPVIEIEEADKRAGHIPKELVWAGGYPRYTKMQREHYEYRKEDLKNLSMQPVHKNHAGKLLIDLRGSDMSECDFRFVQHPHLHEKLLQGVDFHRSWFDFACISNCDAQAMRFTDVHAVGLTVKANRFHACRIERADCSGLSGGSSFDGANCTGRFRGMRLGKNGVDGHLASTWQACKFKEADFSGCKFEHDSMMPSRHKFNGSGFYDSNWRNVDFGGVGEFYCCSMGMDARGSNVNGCDMRGARDMMKFLVDPLPALRLKSGKPGGACGQICVSISKQVCAELEGDDADDDDAEDESDNEDEQPEANKDGGYCSDAYSALAGQAEDELLDLVEQGGNAAGARAVAISVDMEKALQKKFRDADSQYRAQVDALMAGVRAQARTIKSKGTGAPPANAAKFLALRQQVGKLLQGPPSRKALARAEEALKANATPSAVAKFLSAQLHSKTDYDVRGFFPMFRAVLTTSPARIHSDTREINRLINKFEKLDQPVLGTTWTELLDTWITLYEDYSRMKTERAKLIISQIFSNPKIGEAVSFAQALRNIDYIDDPPDDLLRMMKDAKVELKRRVDDYQIAADAELVKMEKIRAKQQQLIGGISILLISVGTSVGSFFSHYFYGKYIGAE